ncbi:MAG: GNAT family N-acetyltransferase, partial [Bacillota bacterium]|nr:GNAT family N-acetyltransferase [Bacillota bacterium]
RKAVCSDLDSIEESYEMHFEHEEKHGAYTLFRRGVYPTRSVAEAAIEKDALYVYEENGEFLEALSLTKSSQRNITE